MTEARFLLSETRKFNWEGLKKAIEDPDKSLQEIKDSNLKGRSGSGFPTGIKWEMTKDCSEQIKYVVCNADEGEPGTCANRVLFEKCPEIVVEGIAACAAIVGAEKAFIYLREEYRFLKEKIEEKIDAMPWDLAIEVFMGAGSYICGEETALLESLEGRRGEPRMKPPYPGSEGLYGKPTVICNAETFACASQILTYGADEFRKYGTESHPGTKLVTLCGNIARPGVYEFPLGITIREMFEYAGGCPNGRALKGMQIGGGSCAIVTPDKLDVRFDESGCREAGISVGTGSILFFDDTCDVAGLCLAISGFFNEEDCGKCTACRMGNSRLEQIMKDLMSGKADAGALKEIETVGKFMQLNSACGLGQAAPTALLSAMEAFPKDFRQHLAGGETHD